jgi:hypothetical protein
MFKYIHLYTALLLCCFKIFAFNNSVDVKLVVKNNEPVLLFSISDNHVLYHDKLIINFHDIQGSYYKPKPSKYLFFKSNIFGYMNDIEIPLNLRRLAKRPLVQLEYQSCDIKKLTCFTPVKFKIEIKKHDLIHWNTFQSNNVTKVNSYEDISLQLKRNNHKRKLSILMLHQPDCMSCKTLLQQIKRLNSGINVITSTSPIPSTIYHKFGVQKANKSTLEYNLLALTSAGTVLDVTSKFLTKTTLQLWITKLEDELIK